MGVTLFFLEKNMTTFFSHRLTFLAVVSSTLPSSYVVYPLFFLHSATKINFRSGAPMKGVTRGGPPSDATGRSS